MQEFIMFMHGDSPTSAPPEVWGAYLGKLRDGGHFEGGSSIGPGACFRRDGVVAPITGQLTGYIRVRAETLELAQQLLAGNPVFEAGGTVEIRLLPRD